MQSGRHAVAMQHPDLEGLVGNSASADNLAEGRRVRLDTERAFPTTFHAARYRYSNYLTMNQGY